MTTWLSYVPTESDFLATSCSAIWTASHHPWTMCPLSHTLPGIKAPAMASAAFPVAAVASILLWLHVEVIDVVHQVLQQIKELITLWAGGAGPGLGDMPAIGKPALWELHAVSSWRGSNWGQ